LGVPGLPATVFVAANGTTFTYVGPALTVAKLRELAAEHLS
jgi:hypothetical protein